MSIIINRTTGRVHPRESPDPVRFPNSGYVTDPDLSALGGGRYPYPALHRHHKIDGNAVVDKSDVEKLAADEELLALKIESEKASLLAVERVSPVAMLDTTVDVVGLEITVSVGLITSNEKVTVVADVSDEKRVRLLYAHNKKSGLFYVVPLERTTGDYDFLSPDETDLGEIGEWSVPANGTELTEV